MFDRAGPPERPRMGVSQHHAGWHALIRSSHITAMRCTAWLTKGLPAIATDGIVTKCVFKEVHPNDGRAEGTLREVSLHAMASTALAFVTPKYGYIFRDVFCG
eukprot:2323793-Pleurochrysis_carterae.AAC.5